MIILVVQLQHLRPPCSDLCPQDPIIKILLLLIVAVGTEMLGQGELKGEGKTVLQTLRFTEKAGVVLILDVFH